MQRSKFKLDKKNIGNFFKETLLYLLVFPALIATFFITLQMIDYTPVTNWIEGWNIIAGKSAAEQLLALSAIAGGSFAPLFVGIKNVIHYRKELNQNTEIQPLFSVNAFSDSNNPSTKKILKNISVGLVNGYSWSQYIRLLLTYILIKNLVANLENPSTEKIKQAEKTITTTIDTLMVLFAIIGYQYGYNLTGPAKNTFIEKIKSPLTEPIGVLRSIKNKIINTPQSSLEVNSYQGTEEKEDSAPTNR